MFDLPEELPLIAVAAGGPQAARIAAELGDALFATEPKAELVDAYHEAGGSGPGYAEVPVALGARREDGGAGRAGDLALGRHRPEGDERAAEPGQLRGGQRHGARGRHLAQFACGPDPARYVEAAQPYVDAGFDRLVLQNAGPDPEGFIEFFSTELADRIRALTPQRSS